jgi:hypothetical protein
MIEPGKTKPEPYYSLDDVRKINPIELYNKGYTNILFSNGDFNGEYSHLPFNIILNEKDTPIGLIKPDESANFIIRKNDIIKYAVVNGFLIDIQEMHKWIGNSIVYGR